MNNSMLWHAWCLAIFFSHAIFAQTHAPDFDSETIEDETEYWRINCTYPIFSIRDDDGALEKLNELVESKTIEYTEDFEKSARLIAFSMYGKTVEGNIMEANLPEKQYYDLRQKWALDGGYEVVYHSASFISLWMFEQQDRGKQDPKMKFHTFNFNVTTANQLLFRDVFKTTRPLSDLKPLIEREILSQGREKESQLPSIENWKRYSVFLHRKSFDNFVIHENEISFCFEPGVLGPKSGNYCRVILSFDDMDAILHPNFKQLIQQEFSQ